MPTRCNRSFYCRSYCLLNMFRASLCPSSGAQEYYTVVAACGILCCGFSSSWSGVELRVMRPVCRMLVYRVLVGKPQGKRPLGRPRRRWEYNIKMDLQEVRGGCGDWMELAQDRDRWRALLSTVMNIRVPKMRGISWLAAEPVSFSRRTLLHGVHSSRA